MRRWHLVVLGVVFLAIVFFAIEANQQGFAVTWNVPEGEIGISEASWKALGNPRPGYTEWVWTATVVNRTAQPTDGTIRVWATLYSEERHELSSDIEDSYFTLQPGEARTVHGGRVDNDYKIRQARRFGASTRVIK